MPRGVGLDIFFLSDNQKIRRLLLESSNWYFKGQLQHKALQSTAGGGSYVKNVKK